VSASRPIVVGLCVLLLVRTAHGQSPGPAAVKASSFVDPVNGLSLADAITLALAHEPSLLAVRRQVEVARGERQQAALRPNPMLAYEQRTEPRGTDAATMLTVEWPLELFRRAGRIAVADAGQGAAAAAVADRERRLVGDVRTRYGEVIAAARDLEVLDAVIEATTHQRDLVAARVDAGAAPPLERDLLQVEAQRLEADQLLQTGRVESALFQLKRVLGMPAHAPLVLRDRLEPMVDADAGAKPSSSIEAPPSRADVREAEARLAMAAAGIARAQREGRADVSVFGTYTRMDAGFPQAGFAADGGLERVRGVFHYVAGGVRLTLPAMNRNQGAVAVADAERAAAQSSLDAARLSADTELAAAAASDQRAQAAVQVYRRGLQALARQNVSTVEQSYALGRLTLLDVLAERRRYLELERAFSDTLRAAYEARTSLWLAGGVSR
jgi:cobalt-zinc-cadmium efflux system outer membrane protein